MFSDRLKKTRKNKGLTLDELAELYNNTYGGGLNKGTLSKYENNKQEPMISVVSNLSDILGVSVDYLLCKDLENKQSFIPALTEKDEKDIAKKLESTLDQLENSQDGLMFDGEPLDEETKELLRISLENSIRLSKQIAKQKYTPKKYR